MKSKLLPNVPTHEKSFFVVDGSIYTNLYQLLAGLRTMPEHTFKYHVNDQKNDFKKWVEDVFGHQKLSADMSVAKDPRNMSEILQEHIYRLQHMKIERKQ